MYAALVVIGYEYHDDYIENFRFSLELEATSFEEAEKAAYDFAFEINWEDEPWARIDSIERVSMA